MKTLCWFLLVFVLTCPNFASNYQQTHVVITPLSPHYGDTVSFTWNGAGDDIRIDVLGCKSNASTLPPQPAGTDLGVSGGTYVREDGVDLAPLMVTMASSAWTGGGADCNAYAEVFSYSGGS